MEEENNGKVTLAVLKNELIHVSDDVSDIKNNHLPHIYKRLNSINVWLIGVLVSVILLLGGMVIQLGRG